MKSVIALLLAFISSAMAFVPQQVTKAAFTTAVASIPVATLSAPALAADSIVQTLPSNTLALEVQFGAYLAVLLGTLLPCLFLVNLYVQTETRKAGAEGEV